MSEHSLVLVTVGDRGEASDIARRLVSERLAAGVQLIPIDSVYTWNEELVEDAEVLMIVKTRTEAFTAVRSLVEEIHSYEVPPILRLDIVDANRPYLDWIDASVTVPGKP